MRVSPKATQAREGEVEEVEGRVGEPGTAAAFGRSKECMNGEADGAGRRLGTGGGVPWRGGDGT